MAMHRRELLASGFGAALTAAASTGSQGPSPAAAPEFYMWRQYILRNGTQGRRLAEFLQAAIPAVNRLGHSPIGVFEVTMGLPTPTVFVLVPSPSLDRLAALDAGLEKDDAFMKAAEPYLAATAADPVYVRQEVSLLQAFPNVPRIEIPAGTAAKAPRIFELRTYESHNERAHRMKMRMFSELGETAIFRRVGLTPVFFGRTLAGPRLPGFTYMLVHENLAAREKSWDGFRTDPEWKKLASTPGYADAEIVSNITTVLLRPAGYSQV
jgi:NIPSNAP protein